MLFLSRDLPQLTVFLCRDLTQLIVFLCRDLAARNVLLDRFLIAKVADFGLSYVSTTKSFFSIYFQLSSIEIAFFISIGPKEHQSTLFTRTTNLWSMCRHDNFYIFHYKCMYPPMHIQPVFSSESGYFKLAKLKRLDQVS